MWCRVCLCKYFDGSRNISKPTKIRRLANISQVYINGEFIGGCDITLELHEKGELKKMIDEANA